MKKYFNYIFFFLMLGCKTSDKPLTGTYVSVCRLYGFPEHIIYIQNDSTYVKDFPYIGGVLWSGKWVQKSDTIFMVDQYEIGENTGKELIDKNIILYPTEFIYIREKDMLIDISNSDKSRWCKLKKVSNKVEIIKF